MRSVAVTLGETYRSVKRPRYLWRICGALPGCIVLERADNRNVLRFVTEAALADDTRYRREPQPAK